MAELTKADKYLLDLIRRGDSEGWSQLVDRYQGRLLAFARSRLGNESDAEDAVQETFIAFLKSLGEFRGEASIETFLFVIVRRKIVDSLRGKRTNICSIRDASNLPAGPDAIERLPAQDPAVSWYVRRDEKQYLQREALIGALRGLIDECKQSGDLRTLEVIEMLFYCRLRNRDISQIAGVSENQVAQIKRRNLAQIRQHVERTLPSEQFSPASDSLLTEIWESQRLSCPKRNTVGAFVLGTLEPQWHQYVEFHLNRLGCGFCLANLEDIRLQSAGPASLQIHERIMQSTVGFMPRT